MFSAVKTILFGSKRSDGKDYTLGIKSLGFGGDNTGNDIDSVYLPDKNLKNIQDRIHNYLTEVENESGTWNNDNGYNSIDGVDETLKLIHEETHRWSESDKNTRYIGDNNRLLVDKSVVDGNSDTRIDELIGYCLRLERNNAYLLNLVEKFENVSFKKRYSDLLENNEKLKSEYDRLKSSNSKIYSSYCDVIEEIRKVQKDNSILKNKIASLNTSNKDNSVQKSTLANDLARLKIENDENVKKLRDVRKSNVELERLMSSKEQELINLRAANLATKLKLERAENLLQLKSKTEANDVEQKNEEKKASKQYDITPPDQTISTPSFPLRNSQNIHIFDPHLENDINKAIKEPENVAETVAEDTIAMLQHQFKTKKLA